MRVKRSKGFTLIEVLIALVILAIALTAVIKALEDSVQDTIAVQNRIYAQWVGMDVISCMQIGLFPLPKLASPEKGEADIFGRRYQWQAGVAKAGDAYYERIYVSVSYQGKPVRRIEGFVRGQSR